MPVAPATIVRTKRSWPGTSITESLRAAGKLELRVAERDRDPALLLLGQPVGVRAGERLDEAGLAVVDVAGRSEREPPCAHRQARTAAATASISSGAIVRQSSSVRSSRTTAITGVGACRSCAVRSRRARRQRSAGRAAGARRRRRGRRSRRPRRPSARRASGRAPEPRRPAPGASAAPEALGTRAPDRGRAAAFLRAPRASACRAAARAAAGGGEAGPTSSARPQTIPA